MRSNQKIIISLATSIVLLLFVSGGLMAHLQNWILFNQTEEAPRIFGASEDIVQANIESGIRTMVVSEIKVIEPPVNAFKQTDEFVMPASNVNLSNDPFVEKAKKTAVNITSHVSKRKINAPALVIYDDELVIEVPKHLATLQNVKRIVARVLLSNKPLSENDLLTKKTINSRLKPFFYKKVLDQQLKPIRYPADAHQYTNYLLDHQTEEYADDEGNFIAIHIPLTETGVKGPAKRYENLVENFAGEFAVDPSLVYAVMETESAFNPKAVSRSNAIGLMQVKANTAGRDVYQYIDERAGQPSKWDLFDSEKNIRMGTAYLSLLKHDYLGEVENEKIKEMLTISSYNGGLSTVLALFGNNSDRAIERINKMSPQQVYRKLKYDHHSAETRRYLDKVLRANQKYKAQLDESV